jgi:hypothetical protein
MKLFKLGLIVGLALLLTMMNGCGGGSSGDSVTAPPDDTVAPVTKTIDAGGGEIELSSGFKVTFPEKSVEGSTQVTVSETSIPAALPSGIQAISPAYKVSTNVGQLNLPAELKFPGESISAANKVGVYRWDEVEQQWKYAGGEYSSDDNTIKTQVDGFSVYIIGEGGFVYKPVEFINNNSVNMVVKVSEYEFNNPDQTARLAWQASTIAWSPTAPGNIDPDTMLLPQGKYSFCAEWWDDGSFGLQKGWYHKLIGDLPDQIAIWLNENSNELVPPTVSLGSNIDPNVVVGRCAPARIFVSADDAQKFDFVGEYNAISIDPELSYEELHAIFTFDSDYTLELRQWINGVESSGTGEWHFDPSTNIFGFSVDGGSSFSGVVSGTTNSFDLRGTWSNESPGVTRLTRP